MRPGTASPLTPDVFTERVSAIRGWLIFFRLCLKLVRHRLLPGTPLPDFVPHKDALARVAHSLFRWRRLRVVNPNLCPADGPAIFVANHHGLDDPALLWPAIHLASGERFIPRFLMRDDFFRGFPWDWLPIRLNTLCERCGAVPISRGRVSPAQLRPALQSLKEGNACALFPGGTRSRTGAWIEYRPGEENTHGDPAALAALAARVAGKPEIPVIPMGITRHPILRQVTVAFGSPIRVASRGDASELAARNQEICHAIGLLTEVHAVHLVAAIIWALCTHHRKSFPLKTVVHAVMDWAASPPCPLVHPELIREPESACRRACAYFARLGYLRIAGREIYPRESRVNNCPPWTTGYRRANPVRYWTNQVLHIKGIDTWAAEWVLGTPPPAGVSLISPENTGK